MEGHFCQMWRTVGFLMNIAAVLELATLIAYLVIIIGGRQKREYGWKVLVGLLTLIGIIQCFAMSTVSYLYDYDHQFSVPGWRLDWGYSWCTFSWVSQIFSSKISRRPFCWLQKSLISPTNVLFSQS
jgi:hypothetical protein